MAVYKYILHCLKCDREYRSKTHMRRYCSECRKTYILKTYTSTFYRNRLIVLKRDKNRCRNCKKTKKLNIHHIDCNKTNNSLSNLITLCESCHHILHGTYTNVILRRNDIFELFTKLNKKKIEDKILFLGKLSQKLKIKPKRFFTHKQS